MCMPAVVMAAATIVATQMQTDSANKNAAQQASLARQQAADAKAAQDKVGPAPQATPPNSNSTAAVSTAQDEQRRQSALRAGFMSTIATSPGGILGTSNSAPKTAGGAKTTLGA